MIYQKEEFIKKLRSIAAEADLLHMTDGNEDKLYTICARLDECSKKFNLTAITDPDEVLKKHIVDCLFFADEIKKLNIKNLIDVGSGAGFPSLPTAAVLPGTDVCALDSTAKKTVYMSETACIAGIKHFTSIAARAEEAGRGDMREAFGAAGARAVARLSVLMELCTPFVGVGGYFVAMKGAAAMEEAKEAEHAAKALGCTLVESRQYVIPTLADKRFLLIYQKNSAAKSEYPRNFSQITKKPL